MSKTLLGLVGLGHMGAAIAGRMLDFGQDLIVFDTDVAAVDRLVARGARRAGSIREVADLAPVVLACLPGSATMRVAQEAASGMAIEVYGELSTMAPATAAAIDTVMRTSGVAFVDGTISGGTLVAERGALSYMMAGESVAVDRLAEIMAPVASHVWKLGERPGNAQLCKLCNNAIGFTLFMATCEALVVGVKAGLDPLTLIQAINASSGVNHWTRDKVIPHILSRRFDAGGKMVDGPPIFDLFLTEARAVGLPDGLVQAGRDSWAESGHHFSDQQIDFSNLVRLFEERAGVELSSRPPLQSTAGIEEPTPISSIGFIGLGHMGGAIAERLIEQGIEVIAFDPDADALARLVGLGAVPGLSSTDVGNRAEIVFACLPTPAVSVAVAAEISVAESVKTYVELSTIGVEAIQKIDTLLQPYGIALVDAPVSGGVAAAKKGLISVLMSGDDLSLKRTGEIARKFGETFRLGSGVGQGQICKIVNNALNFTALVASCEAMVVGVARGINGKTLNDAIAAGSGTSSATVNKIPRAILDGNYHLGGVSKGLLKDLDLYLSLAATAGLDKGVIAAARAVAARAIDATGPDRDVANMMRYFEDAVGVQVRA